MKIQKPKRILTLLSTAGLTALLFSILSPFVQTFIWMESDPSLTAEEREALTALNRKFDVSKVRSLSGNSVLGKARTNSLTASVLLSNVYERPEEAPVEVLIQITNGEILMLESSAASKTEEMLAAYEDLSFVEAAEENQDGVIFADLPTTTNGSAGTSVLNSLRTNSTTRSGSKVQVAVLDSGLDLTHPAFSAENLWENALEKKGTPGKDDDRDGFIDDVYGWNFAQNNAKVNDDNGHGTHIAGIIAARKTAFGEMEGMNPDGAELMILKVAGKDGTLKLSSVLSALDYAGKHGADVVNMSFGFPKGSDIFQKKITELHKKDIFLVAAAGNENKTAMRYPAAYPQVLAVKSLNADGTKWATSNDGPWVDIGAPAKILSTLPAKKYGTKSGTSQAAAVITGAYSYYKSQFPTESTEKITESLEKYASQFDKNSKKLISSEDLVRSSWTASAARILAAGRMPNLLESQKLALSRRITLAEVGGFLMEYLERDTAVLEALNESKFVTVAAKLQPLPLVVSPDLLMTGQFRAALFSETISSAAVSAPSAFSRRYVRKLEIVQLLQQIQKELNPKAKTTIVPAATLPERSLYLSRKQFLELVEEMIKSGHI